MTEQELFDEIEWHTKCAIERQVAFKIALKGLNTHVRALVAAHGLPKAAEILDLPQITLDNLTANPIDLAGLVHLWQALNRSRALRGLAAQTSVEPRRTAADSALPLEGPDRASRD